MNRQNLNLWPIFHDPQAVKSEYWPSWMAWIVSKNYFKIYNIVLQCIFILTWNLNRPDFIYRHHKTLLHLMPLMFKGKIWHQLRFKLHWQEASAEMAQINQLQLERTATATHTSRLQVCALRWWAVALARLLCWV